MAKRKVNAKDVIADIRADMSNELLKDKYRLSDVGLQSLFNKLVEAGLLPQSEVDKRLSPTETAVDMWWTCPACGSPQSSPCEECPQCGVIVEKFLKKQEALDETTESKTVPLTREGSAKVPGAKPVVSARSASEAGAETAGEIAGEVAGEVAGNLVGSLFR